MKVAIKLKGFVMHSEGIKMGLPLSPLETPSGTILDSRHEDGLQMEKEREREKERHPGRPKPTLTLKDLH